MARTIGLPATLAAWGCPVELVDGYATRGGADFTPRAAVSHWTAGSPTGDRGSLKVCIHGRPDLPGPLCNTFLTRAGVAIVVAAGKANHAGAGSWRGITGNSNVFGTEAENSGRGEWTPAQRQAYPRINAAYCMLGGFSPDLMCGHHEWAPRRKQDIADYTMDRMRRETAALLLEGPRGLTNAQVSGLQARVGAGVDGQWGEGTTKALQRWLGVTDDGVIGPGTLKGLQARLGIPQTGQWPGSGTIPALARYLTPGATAPTTTKENPMSMSGTPQDAASATLNHPVELRGVDAPEQRQTSLAIELSWLPANFAALRTQLAGITGELAGQRELLAQLSQGQPVDTDAITTAVRQGVTDALDSIEATVDVNLRPAAPQQ